MLIWASKPPKQIKHVFVCFRVLNLLLWDYLCMKSCLVNPSAFEVLVIKKNQWKLSDFLFNVFTQSYFIFKWRGPLRWGGNGIMRATAVIPDPSRNTLTPQSHSKENFEVLLKVDSFVYFYVLLVILAQTHEQHCCVCNCTTTVLLNRFNSEARSCPKQY